MVAPVKPVDDSARTVFWTSDASPRFEWQHIQKWVKKLFPTFCIVDLDLASEKAKKNKKIDSGNIRTIVTLIGHAADIEWLQLAVEQFISS